MGGLTRRRFLQSTALLAAATGLPAEVLGSRLGAAATPGHGPSTLEATVVPTGAGPYKRLTHGPGEPFVVRDDLGCGAKTGRAPRRRSLTYFGHFSDTHILDAQSPARAEFLDDGYALGLGGAFRPQETLTVQVLDQMVRATNALAASPVTGEPMAFAVLTGDNTDNASYAELRWTVDTLDGRVVRPDTGTPGVYEGVQAWDGIAYAYHPENPANDVYGLRGFPALPGLLDAALAPVHSAGLRVPWLSVFGNHDSLFQGNLAPDTPGNRILSAARTKAADAGAALTFLFLTVGAETPSQQDFAAWLWDSLADGHSRRRVSADTNRRPLSALEYMQEHFVTRRRPGPVGHGFRPANLETGDTWWARDAGPAVRLVGLDSTNHHAGANGCMVEPQYRWLERQLKAHSSRYYDERGRLRAGGGRDRLIVVFSHHTSTSMDNLVHDPDRPYPLRQGEEVVALMKRFPNMVAWVNGHTHRNRIGAHPSPFEPGAGFWEITTASCIDFGQQNRLVEIVDNRDGTLSIFTVSYDHAAHPDTTGAGYSPARLASISRELAYNDFQENPDGARGRIEDRNCELVLRAPFDLLGGATATALEEAGLRRRARNAAPGP